MSVLIYLEGVLKDDENKPIYPGISLYKSLKERTSVVIACEDEKKADRWLKENRFKNIDSLIDRSISTASDFPEWRQFEVARVKHRLDLVVTPNPELAKLLLVAGMPSTLFLHPKYLKEEFRPDNLKKGMKSWEEIVSELERQQDSFAEDKRIK